MSLCKCTYTARGLQVGRGPGGSRISRGGKDTRGYMQGGDTYTGVGGGGGGGAIKTLGDL